MPGAPFPRTEYEDRLRRIHRELDARDLDGLLLTEMSDFEYLTGFQARVTWTSYTRVLAVVVPASGRPTLLVPDFLVDEAGDAAGDAVASYADITRPPIGELAALIRRDLGNAPKVGVELAGETRLGMAPAALDQLRAALPDARFVDGAAAMGAVRMCKSPAEIERLRWACAANSHAFDTVLTTRLEGASERDVARDVVLRATEAGRGLHGWTMPGWIAITSGAGGYGRFLGHPRPRRLDRGDMVWADLGMTVDGYWSDFCRAAVVGGPSGRQRDHQARILEATAVGVELLRPGVAVRDVALAVTHRMQQLGLATFGFGRLGHGIGLTSTELPHVATYDETVLVPGMVVTIEPASVADHGLYCAEQVVVVGDPPEILSLASGELRTA